MSRGVKRKRIERDASNTNGPAVVTHEPAVKRDLLDQCYHTVKTLRSHVLCALPSTSRLRRKKIASLGSQDACSAIEDSLVHLLDTTLVCAHGSQTRSSEARWEQWVSFSQKGDESHVTLTGGVSASVFSQPEIVDFVIWLLFSKEKKAGSWPKHLLCDGFRRNARESNVGGNGIPGLFSLHPNCHVQTLKDGPWQALLGLLGRSGERVMIDLLVDCSIYIKVQAGIGNYYQLSGVPLSELDLSRHSQADTSRPRECRKPSEITFVRSRIFYGKPTLTARGKVLVGYKSIHVLNRHSLTRGSSSGSLKEPADALAGSENANDANIRKTMMYIFPRQFRMHNVFTSQVDTSKTAQAFQDYTLREEEISTMMRKDKASSELRLPNVPKRLRGVASHLVQRLHVLHSRCSYYELLQHYCPSSLDHSAISKEVGTGENPSSASISKAPTSPRCETTQVEPFLGNRDGCSSLSAQLASLSHSKSYVDLASPPSQVSAFAQAVISKIIPSGFWGDGTTRGRNLASFLQKVDHFIKLRRFEAMTLHETIQGLKITDIAWLHAPGQDGQKTSQTDMSKRHEIFNEFVYFIFDSLLIPLIRSNFYVTESNTHRYQLFYFRHDVWRALAEPALSTLKENMFEDVKLNDALQILDSRRIGSSSMRLLPKGDKLRPIMNLRRRQMGSGLSKVLGPSINSVLGPIHSALKLEKDLHSSRLGSTLFSVSDIYKRLKEFKAQLGTSQQALYFAKVDVKAAFDTIPQAAVVKLMSTVPSQEQYVITKHAEVRPGERALISSHAATKPFRRWHATALRKNTSSMFPERVEKHIGRAKKNVIFVNSAVQKTHSVHALLGLLAEHIEQNLVKVGKKYYRQKKGIPQGSVLSSFLCNYFYADLEKKHLGFLAAPDSLLIRLIDDSLLVTLDKSKAMKFVETMHGGIPEYGVEVSHSKTLVNFDMKMNGETVRKTSHGAGFPYCGTLIDSQTLDISKDRDKDKGIDLSNSLTIEFGRAPGQSFQRKVLNAFKIQSHLMFFDTSHNSVKTVHDSLRGAFRDTASKMWAYTRCLSRDKKPRSSLVIRTIIKVAEVAFLILTNKSRSIRYENYRCDIRKGQVVSIAYNGFLDVLSRKQTDYRQVVEWLRKEISRLGPVRK